MSDTRLGEPLPRTFLDNLVRLANERQPDWAEIWCTKHGVIYAWKTNESETLWTVGEGSTIDWTSWCIIRTDWEAMVKQEAKRGQTSN